MKKIIIVCGTRPEAIKLAPVYFELKKHKNKFKTFFCVTAQHRNMLDQVLEIFKIKPDFDLNLMKKNQDLYSLSSQIIQSLGRLLKNEKPDYVIVHGDTTTTFSSAIASFYSKINVIYIESGLRTHNIYLPFPEELNRQIVSKVAYHNFAPTSQNKKNLIKENIDPKKITVTGNTVIDALLMINKNIIKNKNKIADELYNILNYDLDQQDIVLITGHRRENYGKSLEQICLAIKLLASEFLDHKFIYPVHLNPNIKKKVLRLLGNIENISLIKPLNYIQFIYILKKSKVILTDSGGIQEEGPTLGKKVFVLRDKTERPEALETGLVKIVGTESKKIRMHVSKYLTTIKKINRYKTLDVYGKGNASKKIVNKLIKIT